MKIFPSLLAPCYLHHQDYHYFISQRVCFGAAKESHSKIYADPCSSSWQDSDAEAPPESRDDQIPLFDDEDSAAWASFSSNVAIASKSLSSIPVRDFNLQRSSFLIHAIVLGRPTSYRSRTCLPTRAIISRSWFCGQKGVGLNSRAHFFPV